MGLIVVPPKAKKMNYQKFTLTSGQSPPGDGKCLGITIPGTAFLVWAGNDGDPVPVIAGVTFTAMSQAEIDSIQPAAIAQLAAKSHLNALLDAQNVTIRAVALQTLDEINTLRSWLASFKTDVASATSLADLKTRVATLPETSTYTKAQLLTAISSKIASGDATS